MTRDEKRPLTTSDLEIDMKSTTKIKLEWHLIRLSPSLGKQIYHLRIIQRSTARGLIVWEFLKTLDSSYTFLIAASCVRAAEIISINWWLLILFSLFLSQVFSSVCSRRVQVITANALRWTWYVVHGLRTENCLVNVLEFSNLPSSGEYEYRFNELNERGISFHPWPRNGTEEIPVACWPVQSNSDSMFL